MGRIWPRSPPVDPMVNLQAEESTDLIVITRALGTLQRLLVLDREQHVVVAGTRNPAVQIRPLGIVGFVLMLGA